MTSDTPSMSEEFRAHPEQIESLIGRANRHPFGIHFLLEGDLCAVAITFGVTVFHVEAARESLQKFGSKPAEEE